jgi:hypothetical protein
MHYCGNPIKRKLIQFAGITLFLLLIKRLPASFIFMDGDVIG